MSITAEEEPEDIDDDAPSRVRRFSTIPRLPILLLPSLPSALLMDSLRTFPQARSSPP